MLSRQPNVTAILIAVIASLLMCAVAVAELPELITLTDSAANDFAISKTSTSHASTKPSAASYDSFRLRMKYLKSGERVGWTSILESVKPTSASLFILLCTLRT